VDWNLARAGPGPQGVLRDAEDFRRFRRLYVLAELRHWPVASFCWSTKPPEFNEVFSAAIATEITEFPRRFWPAVLDAGGNCWLSVTVAGGFAASGNLERKGPTMKTKKTATKKVAANTAKTKAAKPAKATAKPDAKKLSQIEAAVAVLAKAGEAMNCKAMVEAMAKQGLWNSPGGATPDASLYTVVTMLPKTWQPGIDCSPRTGCDRNMDRGGGRRNPLMFKGLRGALAIRSRCHGRHKNSKNQSPEVAVASSSARVCRRPA